MKKRDYYYIVGIIVLLLILFFGNDYYSTELSDAETLTNKKEAIFEQVLKSNGAQMAIQSQHVLSSSKENLKLIDKVEGLRKIKSQVKAEVRVVIREVQVEAIGGEPDIIHDTVDNIPSNYMKIPQSFGVENKYYTNYFTIDDRAVGLVDSMSMTIKPTYSLGWKDNGFINNIFKKREPVISFELENPDAKIISLNNIIIEDPPKWYQRKGVVFGTGIVAGFFVYKQIVK